MQLATQHQTRFKLLGQKEDLDTSITHFTEAILFHSCFSDDSCFRLMSHGVVTILFLLAQSLVLRYAMFRKPEDVISSVKYFRYLRVNFYPLELFRIPRDQFTSTFVEALAHHAILRTGDETRDMEEMACLIREFGTTDFSKGRHSVAVNAFSTAIQKIYLWFSPRQPPEQAIEVLRDVIMDNPDLEQAFVALVLCLTNRFCMTHVINDCEEAISIVDKFFASHPLGDNLTPTQEKAIFLIIWLIESRFGYHAKPEFLEDAINRLRALLIVPSIPGLFRTIITGSLERLEQKRFDYFGVTRDYVETHSKNAGVVPDSSSPLILAVHQPTVEVANVAILQQQEKKKRLTELLAAINDNQVTDVEKIVNFGRKLRPPARSSYRLSYVLDLMFAEILYKAYLRTNNLEYLNDAITVYRDIGKNSSEVLGRTVSMSWLAMHLVERWKMLHDRQDLDEAMRLYPVLVNDGCWAAYQRLNISCHWAVNARINAHPSISDACERAMSFLQETLVFSPTLQTQHFRLVETLSQAGWMPLDYASYQINQGQLTRAIETLEQGRSLLWSEMRGLRTSTDQLRAANPDFADKFAEINRNLETVATTITQAMATAPDNHEAGGSDGIDPFGNLLMQQRKLLEVRGSLISHIQALPGFEIFLKPSSFDLLNVAAAHGPIILINQSRWRSDIIILLKDSPPSLISTPSDFHDRANRLKEQLLSIRKEKGLDSTDYELTLASVLADLYELVGRPVIERLRQLEVPEESRVWWCPTSAFFSLPLHAMGPIPSADDNKVYFMDLYITSYTQTLSALIESRKPGSHPKTFDKPSLLLVAQPETLPGAWGEIDVLKSLGSPVTALVSEMATPTTVVERLRDHRFTHFVCHGLLKTGEPFDASFELHGGSRLTLLEIIRSHLPTAEFAFLSACHTAELTDESIADEGLHLAAALQYCGFRSVVGTMWAMADTDGRDLSKQFYKSVFSDRAGRRGVPYYARSAEALRDAAKKLRRKRGITLERWVNFVHYGA